MFLDQTFFRRTRRRRRRRRGTRRSWWRWWRRRPGVCLNKNRPRQTIPTPRDKVERASEALVYPLELIYFYHYNYLDCISIFQDMLVGNFRARPMYLTVFAFCQGYFLEAKLFSIPVKVYYLPFGRVTCLPVHTSCRTIICIDNLRTIP